MFYLSLDRLSLQLDNGQAVLRLATNNEMYLISMNQSSLRDVLAMFKKADEMLTDAKPCPHCGNGTIIAPGNRPVEIHPDDMQKR